MNKYLCENLDNYVKGVMNKNTSAVFIIDGRSGLGKTTLSSQVGCYINNKIREWYKTKGKEKEAPDFTLDNMAWTPQEFIDKFENVKKGDIVIMDESMIIGNRSTMSDLNRKVIIMMSMIRSKQVFVMFNINSIFDMDKNLPLHRADMLINVYPRNGKFAQRGEYQVIPSYKGRLKKLYIYGKQFYDYSSTTYLKAFNSSFSAFFPFNNEEYERRKQEAIKNYFVDKTQRDSVAIRARDNLIRYINKELVLTKEEIARIGDISTRTVYRALQSKD